MSPRRLLLGVVGLAVGTLAVWGLREATLSTHDAVAPQTRTAVVLDARTHGGEPTQTLAEMVEAQLLTCRLEVNSDLVGGIHDEGDGRFSALLAPALDQTDRRQLQGCLEDFVIDHLQMNVVHLAVTSAA
jgi:hypothetical protein